VVDTSQFRVKGSEFMILLYLECDLYTCSVVDTHGSIYIYIHIYSERERESEREESESGAHGHPRVNLQ
jgi:hypothetical protein